MDIENSINQPWLIGVVTALYVIEALRLCYTQQYSFAVMFAGYAFANIGIIWAIVHGQS